MPFFKPESYFLVRDALAQAGRADLIGGCDGLIPAHPPKEAIEARRREADRAAQGDDAWHFCPLCGPSRSVKSSFCGAYVGSRVNDTFALPVLTPSNPSRGP